MRRPPSNDAPEPTVIVSGLPRSGTSLMMQILAAAGLPLLCDEARPPDASNPRGYHEFAPVKRTLRDASWVDEARGRAVKVIHALLPGLPRDRRYRVLLMRRPIAEVVASQNAMLARLGEPPTPPCDARWVELLARQLDDTRALLAADEVFDWIEVDYGTLVREPARQLPEVMTFLGLESALAPLLDCIDPQLHRERL